MAYRMFEGKAQASSYWRHRHPPPDHLMQQVLQFLEKPKGRPLELAVDVGCGSGQGTVKLAEHFASVVGTDVSPAQIEMALQHSKGQNITYRECVAEELPFPDSSVDLVTAMSAFHWFDQPRFFLEAHRVLKPGGCMALLSYDTDMELSYPDCCPETLSQICKEFFATLLPHRSPHIGLYLKDLYHKAYESISYPNKEWHDYVPMKRFMPLSNFMGLAESFSHYQTLLKDDPQKALGLSRDISQRIMSLMKVTSVETEVEVTVKYFYILARKPQEV